MKKLLSLLLVLALCLSCGITVLADEPVSDPAAPAEDAVTEAPAEGETTEAPVEDETTEAPAEDETTEEPTETPVEEPAEPAAPVDVTVTVAVEGQLVLARKAVTAHDANNDGVVTIDEALFFAHETYYEGGAAAGYASGETDYGVSLFKLWGDESGSFGYCVDDKSALSLADPVKDGQYIAAYVYADQTGWSDQYSFFNFQTTSTYDGELAVTLSAAGYDADWNPITTPVANATLTLNGQPTEYVTDETGSVTLKLEQKGIFLLSATCEDSVLVPPTAVITVSSFPDSCGHWAEPEIETVVSAGLFGGDDKGNFDVRGNMTRAQLVTVLYRLAGGPAVEGEPAFTDVKVDAYYANAVVWASTNKIVTGHADNTFKPNDAITREQLVTFLYRFAASQSMDTTAGENTNILSYSDIDKVDSYAVAPMQWAVGSGLVAGVNGELLPNKAATRAEVAVVLARFLPGVPMPIGSSMAE